MSGWKPIKNWSSLVEAIERAQAELASDDDPSDDDQLFVHRDLPGEHVDDSEKCWCIPHTFTRAECERRSAVDIAREVERRDWAA